MLRLLALVALVLPAASALGGQPDQKTDYLVVVSQKTHADTEWKKVVDALVKKHDAEVEIYENSPSEALKRLQTLFPKYTCFVTRPEDAGRSFVAEVHQLTRNLDDDIYTDTRWGILTGYNAANALKIAEHTKPLTIEKVASGTDVALEYCLEGMWYDELVKNRHVRKLPGKEAEELKGPDDTTAALVSTLNDYKADLFVTSGHATERDWQIGFRYRNGSFRCQKGQLYGLDTKGDKHPIDSGNPKIYMPIGNCLMGHIDTPEAMATAWMNSAGVMQMLGYTNVTWFGYAGWGVLDYFVEQPGRYTFQEGFLANHHALIHRLADPRTPEGDKRGLTFDRDILAFYGDPAWEAKMSPAPLPFDLTLDSSGETHVFTILPKEGKSSFDTVNNNGSQRGGRPFVYFFPQRLKDIKVYTDNDLKPVITDDFILVPRPENCIPGRDYRVVFTGKPITD